MSAEYNQNDPPTQMECMSSDLAIELFPNNKATNERTSPSDVEDDETVKTENILAEWEDSFDDLGQSDESDDSDCEEIRNADDGRGGYVVVEEEEIGSFSPNRKKASYES